jgi:hypothetical protein
MNGGHASLCPTYDTDWSLIPFPPDAEHFLRRWGNWQQSIALQVEVVASRGITLAIHEGGNASGGGITSWSQTNYGCAGHHGASCSVQGRADLNVGWEVRSSRYYKAEFFGFSNTFCMQIRGGATGGDLGNRPE